MNLEIDADVERVASATAQWILGDSYPDHAEDIVSQVMILWMDWKDRVEHPKAWARRVAKNLCLGVIEEEAKQAKIAKEDIAKQHKISSNDGLLNLITRECQDTLLNLVSITDQARETSLDETDKAIYERYYQKQLDYKEIAADMGMTEDAVRQRGCRLIKKIRNEVRAQIAGDQGLKDMLQHLLDDPKWLGEVLAMIMREIAHKGKEAFERAVRGTTLISL